MDLLSNRVAYKLSEMKIETKWDQGQPVGIYLAQGISFIVAALGVVKAGGCYVSFDPAIRNVTQISPMVSDSKLSVVITDRNYCHKFTHQWPELGLVIVDDLKRHAEHPLIKFSNPNNIPFHILYTSGTSGRQKGVQITHRAVIDLVCHTNYITISPEDHIAHCSTTIFDSMTFDIWGPLLNAGTVVVFDQEKVVDPEQLSVALVDQKISHVLLTTSIMAKLAHYSAPFKHLKTILFGGALHNRNSLSNSQA